MGGWNGIFQIFPKIIILQLLRGDKSEEGFVSLSFLVSFMFS